MESGHEHGAVVAGGTVAPPGAQRRRSASLRPGTLAAVAVGGAVGAPARVELSRVVPSGPGLAWETLLVNVVGSFLLAAGAVLILERLGPTRVLWPLFATGFCGSFTTFSTFAVEVDLHLRSGDVAPGLGYGVVSVALGLAAVLGGAALARSVLRRKAVPDNRTEPPRRRSWS